MFAPRNLAQSPFKPTYKSTLLTKITDNGVTSHGHFSGIRDNVVGYDFEKVGLARAISPDDRNAITPANGEADPAEELTLVI